MAEPPRQSQLPHDAQNDVVLSWWPTSVRGKAGPSQAVPTPGGHNGQGPFTLHSNDHPPVVPASHRDDAAATVHFGMQSPPMPFQRLHFYPGRDAPPAVVVPMRAALPGSRPVSAPRRVARGTTRPAKPVKAPAVSDYWRSVLAADIESGAWPEEFRREVVRQSMQKRQALQFGKAQRRKESAGKARKKSKSKSTPKLVSTYWRSIVAARRKRDEEIAAFASSLYEDDDGRIGYVQPDVGGSSHYYPPSAPGYMDPRAAMSHFQPPSASAYLDPRSMMSPAPTASGASQLAVPQASTVTSEVSVRAGP